MFGNCVWAELSSTHPINNNILNFTRLFNLSSFKAHLTLEYDLKKPFVKDNYELDDLVIDGYPYLTCKDKFYAIQQDYFMKNDPTKKLHISLAYKNGKEFTYKEQDFIRYMKMDGEISKKDIQVHLWNCNSINPSSWKMLA
jgi:hypothetical protein